MSKDEVLCATLDNQSDENIAHNSNTTSVVTQNVSSPVENLLEENIKSELSETELSIQSLKAQDEGGECEVDIMTGSYGEISLEQEISAHIENIGSCETENTTKVNELHTPLNYNTDHASIKIEKRPNSLVIPQSSLNSTVLSTESEVGAVGGSDFECKKCVHKSQQTSDSQATSVDVSPSLSSEDFAIHCYGHQRNGSDTSGLSELQGTLTVDGDMVSFVAEDLQEKIKMSSPVSKWAESSSFAESRSSTPSLYRQALQSNILLTDPNALVDLESHAKKVASCVDTMLENLSGTLQSISSLTVDCMETYETAVCKTCDSVDLNIKAVYQLMAKCEELSNSMGPLHRMADDVKNIKKVLDQLEFVVEHKS